MIVCLHLVALLVWLVPWWGIPLHTDSIPIYRLQVSTLPGLADAVPYGLRVATAYPMGSWEACVEQYRAFSRFSCLDIWIYRAIAQVADGNADIWRSICFAMNAASIALF